MSFEEIDRYINPQYTAYIISGWGPDDALSSQHIIHFYRFSASKPTPVSRIVKVDYTVF